MRKLPDYYETLNVSKDASAEEVKISYAILKKMFGSDATMAAELAAALETLIAPEKRHAYDRSVIEEVNRKAAGSHYPVNLPGLPEDLPAPVPMVVDFEKVLANSREQRESLQLMNNDFLTRLLPIACSIAIVASLMSVLITNPRIISSIGVIGLSDIFPQSYSRPATAPNGTEFPAESGYISGYMVSKNDGKSSLYVSNIRGEHDVYLKLLSLENGKPVAARHVMVKAKAEFKLENIAPGTYEVQYLDLEVGLAGKSEVFVVAESVVGTEVRGTSLSLTLKTAVDGVLRVEKVPVSQFNSLASL